MCGFEFRPNFLYSFVNVLRADVFAVYAIDPAVALASVALYSQSRGAVYSIPIVLVLVFLLLPGRVRSLASLIPIGIGAGACVPAVLRLDERVEAGASASAAAHAATLSVLLASLAVAIVVAVLASIENRSPAYSKARGSLRRGIAVLAMAVVLAAVVGAVAVGKPVGRVEHAWNTFTSLKGYEANSKGESRLTGGFGSNRYDFYRVAWHEFLAHPLLGIGADNFAEQYLRLGHSLETPHYPHSVELRTLAETGIIGTLLAVAGLIASFVAVKRALRDATPLARAVVVGALAGFGYWVIHGSFDWFFEYAGLGAAAFMLLGVCCSLVPAREMSGSPMRLPVSSGLGRTAMRATTLAIVVLAALSLAAPWLSRMEAQSAARVWTKDPSTAYARLRQAAQLNPLSAEPDLIAGTIALRLEDLEQARRRFEQALGRSRGNAYATLELGAIASALRQPPAALRFLERAVYLNPRNGLAREALALVRSGGHINIDDLNRSILREAEQFS